MMRISVIFILFFTSLVYAETMIERLERQIDNQIEQSEVQAENLNQKILVLTTKLNKAELLKDVTPEDEQDALKEEIHQLQEIQSEILISISQLKLKKEFYFSAR